MRRAFPTPVAIAAAFAAFVCLALASCSQAAEPAFPPLTGRVVDDAGVLSPDTKQKLTD